MKRLWILGADDVEMATIERILKAAGEPVAYATDANGSRVHPGSAYRAEGMEPTTALEWDTVVYLVECDGLHLRDACGILDEMKAGHPGREFRVIDHHREGDAGYGRPPEQFLPASSLGQVVSELAKLNRLPWTKAVGHPGSLPGEIRWTDHGGSGWAVFGEDAQGPWRTMIPDEIVWAAAADHCLAAAYQGQCPGVDPDTLMWWRAVIRADHQGRTVNEVLTDVAAAREALKSAKTWPRYVEKSSGYPIVTHDLPYWVPWVETCDVRRRCYAAVPGGEDDPEGYIVYSGPPLEYTGGLGCYDEGDCHPHRMWEIDGQEPQPWHYLRDMREHTLPELPEAACREGVPYLATVADRDGRQKVVLGGYAPPELVKRFMSGELVPGLKDIYGDPARGFAGGYIQPKEEIAR